MKKQGLKIFLNVKYHRMLGHIDAIKMTFRVKREYYIGFVYLFVALAIPIAFAFNMDIMVWDWFPFLKRHPSFVWLALMLVVIIILCIKNQLDYRKYKNMYYAIPGKDYKAKLLKKLVLPEDMRRDGYHMYSFFNGKSDEFYVLSSRVNRFLQGNPKIELKLLKRPFSVGEEIAYLIPSILSGVFGNSGRLLFNGKLLRMAQELYVGQRELYVQKARYFDGQCTNEIVYKKFRAVDRVELAFDGSALLCDKNHTLYDLAESPCANFLGVSTLAVTKDNQLMIGKQGDFVKANVGRYAPSGSGSVDFADLTDPELRHPVLCELLVSGMERELREEMSILGQPIRMKTTVIGYARLMERGGKPDFFGITYLDETADKLKEYRIRMAEQGLQDPYESLPFTELSEIPKVLHDFCREHLAQKKISIQVKLLADILEEMQKRGKLEGLLHELKSNVELRI